MGALQPPRPGSINRLSTPRLKYESWRGFYKGLGPNLLRVTPATMVTFVTYENVSRYLLDLGKAGAPAPSSSSSASSK